MVISRYIFKFDFGYIKITTDFGKFPPLQYTHLNSLTPSGKFALRRQFRISSLLHYYFVQKYNQ